MGRLENAVGRSGGFVDGGTGKFALTESISPLRWRVSFWMPRKKPKRHQGAAQDERFALIFAAPGPHFTGAQLGSLAVIAKARVAQLTGCPSIAAAAELTVTFGGCSYRWKARLLCGWGSSAAQGIGGRVRTPAPTEYPETRLSLRRGRSQTGPGACRRPSVPPLRRKTDRERWFGKLRRRCGIAPASIFRTARPQWAGRN